MTKKIPLFFYNNKFVRKLLEYFLVLAYAAVFCLVSFSNWLSYSELTMEDFSFQGREERSEEVVVIAVTDEDLEYYRCSEGEIAAKALEALSQETDGSVIGLDVDVSSLDEQTTDYIRQTASGKENIVLPEKLEFDIKPVIDELDEASDGIEASGSSSPFEKQNTGHNNIILDSGGILRHAVFDITDTDGKTHESLVEACCDLYFSQQGLFHKNIRLSDQNTAIVRYYAGDSHDYSAGDILEGRVEISELNDRLILIGYDDIGAYDRYIDSSDYDEYITALLFDANTASNILEGTLGLNIPVYIQIIFLALAIIILEILVTRLSFFPSFCVAAAYELGVQLVGMFLNSIGWVGYTMPHIVNGILSLFVFSGMAGYLKNTRKNRELSELLGRYLDISVVNDLGQKPAKFRYTSKDARKEKVAVLFADIRKFTALSEKIETEVLFDILNRYLSIMANCINKYGGTVDKFIGDCVMGYWIVKGVEYDPVYKACLSAAEMQRRCKELEKTALEEYGVSIEIGIGISYGDAMVGNIGSADRSNYTVIGDTVNLASRLENLAPGGEIYISAWAAESLGNRAKCESLGKNITLKNIAAPVEVFRLVEISPVSTKNLAKDYSDNGQKLRRHRKLRMIIAAFIVFMVDFLSCFISIRSLGSEVLMYYSIGLSVVGAIVMIFNITRCMKEYTTGRVDSPGSFWPNISRLIPLSLHNQIFIMGVTCAIFGEKEYFESLPGSWVVFIACPVFMAVSWILFGEEEKYRFSHALVSIVPTILVILISGSICFGLNPAGVSVSTLLSIYNIPLLLAGIAVNFLLVLLITKLHDRVCSRIENRAAEKKNRKPGTSLHDFVILKYLSEESTGRHILHIVLNVLIGVLSIRSTIKAYLAGGVSIFSNPSIIGAIVFITCVISIIHEIRAINSKYKEERNRVYRYVSFTKMLGNMLNFLTILMLAVAGEGLKIFFELRWNADWTVFLLCPVISIIMWAVEKNDYVIWKCLLCCVPYVCILPVSKVAISSAAATRSYAYELSNFYDTRQIIIIIIGEFIIALVMGFLSRTFAKILSSADGEGREVIFSVCGNRHGVVADNVDNRIYGQHSECYVLRTGDYGLVLNAGSGLLQAIDRLSGCTDVDILITSNEFCMVMGFLVVNNLCPGARIRIISPFGINTIAARPYWPVNTVKGVYERIKVGRKHRLNNDFSVELQYSDRNKNDCMVKISGKVRVCYTGRISANGGSGIDVAKWAYGSDLLIYDAYDNIQDGCYMAMDTDSSYLILSGFRPDMDDRQLIEQQDEAARIVSDASLGKENENYLIK